MKGPLYCGDSQAEKLKWWCDTCGFVEYTECVDAKKHDSPMTNWSISRDELDDLQKELTGHH